MGLNQFPSLPDKFDPGRYDPETERAEHEGYYLEHCLPTIAQIASKLNALREENPGLRRVYVLSNGWGWWLDGLRRELVGEAGKEGKAGGGWDDLKSSGDLKLDGEQGYVGMAVDMAIAEKAEVFVGNGVSCSSCPFLRTFFFFSPPTPTTSPFSLSLLVQKNQELTTTSLLQFSSLSSNVVMLRMAKGLDPSSNRFL
jgi:hypothetical protein